MDKDLIILNGPIVNWTSSQIPMVSEEMAARNDVPASKLVMSQFESRGSCCFRDTADFRAGEKIGLVNAMFPLYADVSVRPSALQIAQSRCERGPWPQVNKFQDALYIVPRIMILHAVVENECRNRRHILERMLVPAGRVSRNGGTVGFTGFVRGIDVCSHLEQLGVSRSASS